MNNIVAQFVPSVEVSKGITTEETADRIMMEFKERMDSINSGWLFQKSKSLYDGTWSINAIHERTIDMFSFDEDLFTIYSGDLIYIDSGD